MDNGTPIPEFLASRGVIPGIKVDTGAKDLAGRNGEKITERFGWTKGKMFRVLCNGG